MVHLIYFYIIKRPKIIDFKLTFIFFQNAKKVARITEEDLEFQPIKWNRIVAWSDEEGKFSVSIPKSESGFRAVMIEVSYPGPDDRSRMR